MKKLNLNQNGDVKLEKRNLTNIITKTETEKAATILPKRKAGRPRKMIVNIENNQKNEPTKQIQPIINIGRKKRESIMGRLEDEIKKIEIVPIKRKQGRPRKNVQNIINEKQTPPVKIETQKAESIPVVNVKRSVGRPRKQQAIIGFKVTEEPTQSINKRLIRRRINNDAEIYNNILAQHKNKNNRKVIPINKKTLEKINIINRYFMTISNNLSKLIE